MEFSKHHDGGIKQTDRQPIKQASKQTKNNHLIGLWDVVIQY
jgi:hypothetical protein